MAPCRGVLRVLSCGPVSSQSQPFPDLHPPFWAMQLAKELMRFLAAIADDTQFLGASRRSSLRRQSIDITHVDDVQGRRTVGTQTEAIPNMDKFLVDLLLSRYARNLLATQRIRALGLFSLNLSFPLRLWLSRERCVTRDRCPPCLTCCLTVKLMPPPGSFARAHGCERNKRKRTFPPHTHTHTHTHEHGAHRCRAARLESYDTAFAALHEQFNWPLPGTGYGGGGVVPRLLRSNTIAGPEHRRSTAVRGVQRTRSVNWADTAQGLEADEAARELRHLLDLFVVAQCVDWAALIATALQSSVALHTVIVTARNDPDNYGGADRVVDNLKALAASPLGCVSIVRVCSWFASLMSYLLSASARDFETARVACSGLSIHFSYAHLVALPSYCTGHRTRTSSCLRCGFPTGSPGPGRVPLVLAFHPLLLLVVFVPRVLALALLLRG